MLAAGADALLRVGRAGELCQIRVGVRGAQEDGLELVHPGVRKKQRGVGVRARPTTRARRCGSFVSKNSTKVERTRSPDHAGDEPGATAARASASSPAPGGDGLAASFNALETDSVAKTASTKAAEAGKASRILLEAEGSAKTGASAPATAASVEVKEAEPSTRKRKSSRPSWPSPPRASGAASRGRQGLLGLRGDDVPLAGDRLDEARGGGERLGGEDGPGVFDGRAAVRQGGDDCLQADGRGRRGVGRDEDGELWGERLEAEVEEEEEEEREDEEEVEP